jgi:hypothetical protein
MDYRKKEFIELLDELVSHHARQYKDPHLALIYTKGFFMSMLADLALDDTYVASRIKQKYKKLFDK